MVRLYGGGPCSRCDRAPTEIRVTRLLDIAVAASALAVSSPLLLLAAIGIRLTSLGPTFYRRGVVFQ
jgi:lipopolysaccharide/colanic/teichoic acid biosynthesis glycosyltransferase